MYRSLPTTLLSACSFAALAQFGPQHFAFVSDVDYPYQVLAGDLDTDGDPDALVVLMGDLYWFPNEGGGVFGDRQLLVDVSLYTSSNVFVRDFDMDGINDVLANSSLYGGLGGGLFGSPVTLPVAYAYAALSDFDGDGDPDLLSETSNNIAILFNDGSGNFSWGPGLGPAGNVNTISADHLDVNGDALPDIVIGGENVQVGWYANLGGGSYGPRNVFTGLPPHTSTLCGDVDADGDNDVVVNKGSQPKLTWWANDGNGTFTLADTIAQYFGNGTRPALDLDGDGDLDFAAMTSTSCNVRWWMNTGNGASWSETVIEDFNGYNLQGTRYAMDDFDGDGVDDMLIAHGLGIIAWYPNNGDGTFGPRQRIGHELGGGSGMSVIDLDGDGDNDIAAVGVYGDWVTTYANNGDGTFAQQEVVLEHLDQVNTCNSADLDGDGFPELLTNKPAAAVLWNDGTGHFSAGTLPNDGTGPLPVDLDGDLYPDLVGTGAWYRNDGSGNFTEQVDSTMNITGATAVMSGLLNGDAVPDLVYFGTTVNVLLNDGNGAFNVLTTTPTAQLMVLDVADLDGDGDNDLVGISYNDVLYGYFNDGDGVLTEQQLLVGTQGTPRHILIHDINGDGYPDVVWARSNGYDHKTYASLNNGDGTLGAIFIVDPSAESTASLAFADVNGDAVPDLVESRFHTIAWQENHFFDAFRLRGDVFKDYDQNGVRDVTDSPLPFLPMRTAPGAVLNWTNSSGQFDMAVDSGTTYQLWPHLPSQFHVTSEPDTVITEANVSEPIIDSLLFGVGPVIPDDFEAITFTRTLLRCNTAGAFYVDVRNAGATILTDVLVQVVLDPDFIFDTAWPAPDSVVANTVYWSIDNMDWLAIAHLTVNVIAGPVGSSGMATCNVAFTSTGATAEETSGLPTITCAFDPNLKDVLPVGIGTHHAVPIDQDWLDFTIHFQNTGTDTAFNVLLIDRLGPDLEWSSMEVLGTSHPLTNIFIEEDGELNFRYDHINLPDSGSNMAGSNGYVRFRMRPLADRPNLTEIHNTAEIYFDYNAPVITNTTLTTLVDCDAFSSSITQLGADLLQASEGTTYQWYRDGQAIAGAASQELVVEVTGFYSVEVTNEYGCALMSEELQVVISGVENASSLHMAVLPNPMSDASRLIFSEALSSDTRIELMDVNGRVARTKSGNGSREVLLDREHLESGIYLLRVTREGEAIGSARVVIR